MVRLAKASRPSNATAIEIRPPIKPKWAPLISEALDKIPIACPKCGKPCGLVHSFNRCKLCHTNGIGR